METLFLNETLRVLFLWFKHNPEQLVSIFDNSKSIAAFDFNLNSVKFNCISHSANSFLGGGHLIRTPGDILANRFIHPLDVGQFKKYFNFSTDAGGLSEPEIRNFIFKCMRCRVRHNNGYWKRLIFISFDYKETVYKNIHKCGLIADEMVDPKFLFLSGTNSWALISNKHEHNDTNKDDNIRITRRENEILEFLGKGMIAKEIAGKLNISITTVISHRKNLINKFRVKNTAELILQASKLMLI